MSEAEGGTDNEEQMLVAIAANMKEITPEELNERLKNQIQALQHRNSLASEISNSHPKSAGADIEVDKEINTDENPQLMAVSSVIQMFQQIQVQVQQLKDRQRRDLDKKFDGYKKSIDEQITKNLDFNKDNQECALLKADFHYWKHKSEVLTDVVDRLNTEVRDLTQRIENVELSNNKKSVIISGLTVLKEKSENWELLNYFFKEILPLPVVIEDYFTLGSNFVVSFRTMEEKRMVMKNKNLLRHIRGLNNTKIFINEYLPPAIQEKRRREKEITSQLEEQGKIDQVTYTRSGLTIAGVPYRKKVVPPTPKELVNIEVEELQRILKLKIKKDSEISQDKSTFSAYIGQVETHQQIRDFYKKMKMIQPGARHIVCAYNIDHQEEFYAQDYHDDNEPGAGRVLLSVLMQNNMKNHVIFVARKYGGIRMGAERFQCYSEVCKAALMSRGIQITNQTKMPGQSQRQKVQEQTFVPQQSQSDELQSKNQQAANKQYQAPRPQRKRGTSTRNARGYSGRGFQANYGRGGAIRGAHSSTQYQGTQQLYSNLRPDYDLFSKTGQLFPRSSAEHQKTPDQHSLKFGFRQLKTNDDVD